MSIWSDIEDRSNGTTLREEDIRRGNWTVRITSTESFASYDHIRLTPTQKKSFRWHGFHLELRDDRFKQYVWWSGGIITRKCDTGKKTLEGFVEEVLKEFKYFDGFDCDEIPKESNWHKKVCTDKNKKMIGLINGKVNEHNAQMMQEIE
jgi:hypothetical protein